MKKKSKEASLSYRHWVAIRKGKIIARGYNSAEVYTSARTFYPENELEFKMVDPDENGDIV